MKARNILGLVLSLLTLVMFGCGGGNGGTASSTTVSGEASKGPIIGGDVKIYAINSNGVLQSTPLTTTPATVTTKAPFGNYSAVISYSGPIKVVVTGGSYTDEITGSAVDMTGKSLSAVVASATGSVRVAVTPLTELAVQKAGSTLTSATINAANTGVANAMGLKGVDIVGTSPSTSTAYKFALAAISAGAGTGSTGLTDLLTQTAAGIDITTGSITDQTVSAAIANANATAYANTNIDHSGIVSTDAASITLSVPSATQTVNTPVSISATVKQMDGSLAANKTVTFHVASGTGNFSSATATTNSSGVATVTLTSDVEGTVKFTASADNFTSSASVTFSDPNKPGGITLAVSPTTGLISNGQGQVTLTATVTPVSSSGTLATGTVVTFKVLTGTGTISAVTTTNASGVATATLNSTVVGTVTVNATAGTSPVVTSNTVSVPFITQPTLAIVKVATQGTLPSGTTIGGITAHVLANPSSGLSISNASSNNPDITVTGAGVGSTFIPNATNVANIILGLVNASGIQSGEFATLNYHIASGTSPTAGDFTIASGATVVDTNGASISGMTVVIKSVTIQ